MEISLQKVLGAKIALNSLRLFFLPQNSQISQKGHAEKTSTRKICDICEF